jgi:hypothetical protein
MLASGIDGVSLQCKVAELSRRASDVNPHGKWDVILWPAGSCSHWRERIKELSSNEFLRRRCTTQLRLVEVRSLESA